MKSLQLLCQVSMLSQCPILCLAVSTAEFSSIHGHSDKTTVGCVPEKIRSPTPLQECPGSISWSTQPVLLLEVLGLGEMSGNWCTCSARITAPNWRIIVCKISLSPDFFPVITVSLYGRVRVADDSVCSDTRVIRVGSERWGVMQVLGLLNLHAPPHHL